MLYLKMRPIVSLTYDIIDVTWVKRGDEHNIYLKNSTWQAKENLDTAFLFKIVFCGASPVI